MSTITQEARDAELPGRIATIMLKGIEPQATRVEDYETRCIAEQKATLRPFQARVWAWLQTQPDLDAIEVGRFDGTCRFNVRIHGDDESISWRLARGSD